MLKIAICGKANSGKNTLSKIIKSCLKDEKITEIAFADEIKKIAKIMFPQIPNKFLYGSSLMRKESIKDAVYNGNPLTIRQLLINIGNSSRDYNPDIWVNLVDNKIKKINNSIIITDLRFQNEFEFLKKNNFTTIKIIRDKALDIKDKSELEQDLFTCDHTIINNSSLEELKDKIKKILEI